MIIIGIIIVNKSPKKLHSMPSQEQDIIINLPESKF